MSYDSHIKNPNSMTDYGPATMIQPRLTGGQQTGRLVIIGNPISYVVEPGRYYPFLSLRGHNDPASNAIRDQLAIQRHMGMPLPDNREPRHATSPTGRGQLGSLAFASTRGAVTEPPRRPFPDTTLGGVGPEGLPPPYAPLPNSFFGGLMKKNPGRL
jgi:hypothetical protein